MIIPAITPKDQYFLLPDTNVEIHIQDTHTHRLRPPLLNQMEGGYLFLHCWFWLRRTPRRFCRFWRHRRFWRNRRFCRFWRHRRYCRFWRQRKLKAYPITCISVPPIHAFIGMLAPNDSIGIGKHGKPLWVRLAG